MHAFNITISLAAEKPGNLDRMLDGITSQLTIMCSCEAYFEDFIVTRHVPGDTTFLIAVCERDDDEVRALVNAITWLDTALKAAGYGTPGWLRRAEQVLPE